ncbi:MAG: carboxypeptidase-like regulatory domain-containing protein [Planctomycetota bacterium]
MASRRLWLVVAGIAVLSMGCSKAPTGPKKVPAGGKVTYKNVPVEGATVSFLGDGKSAPAVAITDASGEFVLTTNQSGDGAVPGTHRVTVTKIIGQPVKSSGSMSMDDAAKTASTPAPKQVSPIPEKYNSVDSSGLQFTVKEGDKNHFAIELKD